MSQIPPLANYFWVSFTVEQLLSSVQLFKCQFYQAELSWWYKSVVKEDCNFSNFGTEAFLVSWYLGHRFCTRFFNWRNPLHGDDKNQMILALFRRWSSKSWKSSKSSTERLIVDSFQGACLNLGCMTAKKKTNKNKHSQRTFPWSSVRCLCPISSCSVSGLSLIHIWRCRRSTLCRSRWSPYH